MIISASRRTDIPSFYSEWFLNRIREKYVLVPNPYNPQLISKISLHPKDVDCIVFWTKNPLPMIKKLDCLNEYKYYFQFTLNPYQDDIEINIPLLSKKIEIFKKLSDKIGKEKVVWRYDPILINEKYNLDFHKEMFAHIVDSLKDYTERCMLGFIDHYSHIKSKMNQFNIQLLRQEEIEELAISFKKIIDDTNIKLDTCTAKVNLERFGIPSGMCIDKDLIENIIGHKIIARKDTNQRHICNCVESIDIGMYSSCLNGCAYCYAIQNSNTVKENFRKHDKNSPLLLGSLNGNEAIKERNVKTLKTNQQSLF